MIGLLIIFLMARLIYIKNKPLNIDTLKVEKGTLVESVSVAGKVKAEKDVSLTLVKLDPIDALKYE